MPIGRRGFLTLRREDGRIVCETVQVADTILRRMRGLLGRKGLEPGDGLLLRPAWSIHTMFMRFPIDVVFVDHDLIVLRIAHSLRPFKTASCRGAREVVELSAGECERRGLEVGDRVAWASRTELDSAGSPGASHHKPDHRAEVLLASGDQRFAKLAEFLLEGHGIGVADRVQPSGAAEALDESDVDAVLLDAGDGVADALRVSNAIRSSRPDLPVVIVGDGAAARAPNGVSIYDKWEQTGEAIDALAARVLRTSPDKNPDRSTSGANDPTVPY